MRSYFYKTLRDCDRRGYHNQYGSGSERRASQRCQWALQRIKHVVRSFGRGQSGRERVELTRRKLRAGRHRPDADIRECEPYTRHGLWTWCPTRCEGIALHGRLLRSSFVTFFVRWALLWWRLTSEDLRWHVLRRRLINEIFRSRDANILSRFSCRLFTQSPSHSQGNVKLVTNDVPPHRDTFS